MMRKFMSPTVGGVICMIYEARFLPASMFRLIGYKESSNFYKSQRVFVLYDLLYETSFMLLYETSFHHTGSWVTKRTDP